MVDIYKEGFVKIIPRSYELKNYFFYLTFNNRAEVSYYVNPTKLMGILDNNEKIIFDKGNLNLFFSYLNSVNSEKKGHKIKALELIMSYSTDFNQLMIDIYGLDKWKDIYSNILNKLLKKFFYKHKTYISYIHTFDSHGIRVHNHTILYPYKLNNSTQIYELFTYIPEDILKDFKKEYNLISKQLIKKNLNKIKSMKNRTKYKKYLQRI